MKSYDNSKRDAKRAARRAKLLYQHPRCVMCFAPIVLKVGSRYDTRTCGGDCAKRRDTMVNAPVRRGQAA